MSRICPFCLKEAVEKTLDCNCGFPNFNIKPFRNVPNEIKNAIIVKTCKNKRDKPTRNEIEILLKDAAKKCNFNINSIKINETTDGTDLISITVKENICDVELYYNPIMLCKFTDDEIKAALRHELFHPITIKGKFEFLKGTDMLQKTFTKIYFEMINHKKHIHVIPNDLEFREVKYATLLLSISTLIVARNIANEEHRDQLWLYLFRVLELTIYYFYDDGTTMSKLIKKYNFQATWKFFGWINNDLTFLQKNIDDIRDNLPILTIYMYSLTKLVNVKKLLLKNEIVFSPDEKKDFLENKEKYTRNDILRTKLYEFWEKRILENNK